MHVLHVVGARPNFMKIAPVMRALRDFPSVRQTVVHTGQHYDFNMSDVFFQELGIPAPDINLDVGSGSHAQQTAEIMRRFEPVMLEQRPDIVLVYGDVNSTAAAAMVCSKLLLKVGHVEAGLRSFDRAMPEEINRLVTDQLSDILFTPSDDGNRNLIREGIAADKIHMVGNVMIDTLLTMLPKARASVSVDTPRKFVLATLHRPSNVDDTPWLAQMLKTLTAIGARMPVLFPVHPRTRQCIANCRIDVPPERVRLMDPLSYLEFLGLQTRASLVITDSGGIQEETTVIGVPCLTVRENTERPVTVDIGTNILVGRCMDVLLQEASKVLDGKSKAGGIPPLWDGHAGERIASILTG